MGDGLGTTRPAGEAPSSGWCHRANGNPNWNQPSEVVAAMAAKSALLIGVAAPVSYAVTVSCQAATPTPVMLTVQVNPAAAPGASEAMDAGTGLPMIVPLSAPKNS